MGNWGENKIKRKTIINAEEIRKEKRKMAVENKDEVRVSVQGERGQKNTNRRKDTKTDEFTAFCWLRTRRVKKKSGHILIAD